MKNVVSITSRGQLTLPKRLLKEFGVKTATKALVEKRGRVLIVEPRKDFNSLAGSLRSKIKLSDAALKRARRAFVKQWPHHA